MSKWKHADNLNKKGLAVEGVTSSTVADDTHTETNGGSSRQHKQQTNQK